MKKMFLFACLFLVPALFVFGCGTSTGTTTTTTTIATTTTTNLAPGAASISGRIPLKGVAGTLYVGATTDDTFLTTEGWSQIAVPVSASDTYYDYDLDIDAAGTYYILAMLNVGTTEVREWPQTGDFLGEYSDGLIPSSLGGTGTPASIDVTTGPVIGKDFQLLFTW